MRELLTWIQIGLLCGQTYYIWRLYRQMAAMQDLLDAAREEEKRLEAEHQQFLRDWATEKAKH